MNYSEYIVVYDITLARERRKVDKICKGYGRRIQKSVFECALRRRDKKNLIEELNTLDIKTGFVKIYRLEYPSDTPVIGKPPENCPDNDSPAFIV